MCRARLTSLLVSLGCLGGCAKNEAAPDPPQASTLTVSSPSFTPRGPLPAKYTCEGEDISPALAWSGAPPATKSFAVLVDDPDAPDPAAPKAVFVHWILYDIPPTTGSLAEGTNSAAKVGGAHDGRNDYAQTSWKGPCPPKGRHRYFFKIYALDVVLPDMNHPNKAELEKAMSGHVLASGEVVGTYEKQPGG